jgi:hypothetical protein
MNARLVVPALLGLCLVFTCAAVSAAPSNPPATLLLGRDGLDLLKQRIEGVPAAKAYWNDLKSRVDATLDKSVDLPPRGGNWFHWYVCPEHGNRLRSGRRIGPWQWEHVCPVDGAVHRGDPSRPQTDLDGCRISGVHRELADLARDAGLLHQVTGDARYSAKARQVLLAYAEKYASYPRHTTRGEDKIGGGKVGAQSLDESTWLITMTQAADLVWTSLSQTERETAAAKLLQPAARQVILPHRMGVHNIQCWKNSAVGLVGFLLEDKELIAAALDDAGSGFHAQIAKGINADGAWWEGAWGYHFYTINALLPLTEAARSRGIDLYTPALKKMFDAPLAFAMPNGVLPNFNDSAEVKLAGHAPLYEIAYARFKDPRYLGVLAGSDRGSLQALLQGVATLPPAAALEAASANHTASGFAILRRGADASATWLALDYGPHGGGHGHPDKLSFVLYGRGQVLAPDAGITSYGSPLHQSWFRTSIAHNTLVVDEKNQRQAEGRCLAFGTQGGVDYVTAEAGTIADGVRFIRTVAMLDADTVVFVDQVLASSEHTFDLALHHRGFWDALPDGQAWSLPRQAGYSHLKDATVRTSDAGAALAVRGSEGLRTSLTLAGGEATEIITGTGPGASTAERVPTLILRRKAKETAFVWCLSLSGATRTLKMVPVCDRSGKVIACPDAVGVEINGGDKAVRLLVNPDRQPVKLPLAGGTEWKTDAAFGVK